MPSKCWYTHIGYHTHQMRWYHILHTMCRWRNKICLLPIWILQRCGVPVYLCSYTSTVILMILMISYTTSSSFTISWLAQLPKIWLVPLVQEHMYHSRIVFGHVYQCKALDLIDLCEYITVPCKKSIFVKQVPIILACVGSHAETN